MPHTTYFRFVLCRPSSPKQYDSQYYKIRRRASTRESCDIVTNDTLMWESAILIAANWRSHSLRQYHTNLLQNSEHHPVVCRLISNRGMCPVHLQVVIDISATPFHRRNSPTWSMQPFKSMQAVQSTDLCYRKSPLCVQLTAIVYMPQREKWYL